MQNRIRVILDKDMHCVGHWISDRRQEVRITRIQGLQRLPRRATVRGPTKVDVLGKAVRGTRAAIFSYAELEGKALETHLRTSRCCSALRQTPGSSGNRGLPERVV